MSPVPSPVPKLSSAVAGIRSHWRGLAFAAVALGLVLWGTFAPKSVEVDAGEVSRGPMEMTIDEDGITRYRDVYVVTAPLAGEMQRLEWQGGDQVACGETLAVILPAPASLLDPRARLEAEARVKAAEAALDRSEAQLRVAAAELEKSERYVERDVRRVEQKLISTPVLEDTRQLFRLAQSTHEAAVAAREMARFDVRVAEAALQTGWGSATPGGFPLTSPIDGVVLDVPEESSRVVGTGETILRVGDPSSLEVRSDILSQDAVRVRPGQGVRIEHWGGEQILRGTVTRVEPSAYTKVSALGVDEQRVWVTVALNDAGAVDETGTPLGHGYRVEVRIVVWESDDVARAPAGTVFRSGTGWGAYRITPGGRAAWVAVDTGRRNAEFVEVLGGLEAGDRLVLHPGDRVGNGTRLRVRENGRP